MSTRVSIGLIHVQLSNGWPIFTKLDQFCPKVSTQISCFHVYTYHEQVVCSSICVINLGGPSCVSILYIELYLNITYFFLCAYSHIKSTWQKSVTDLTTLSSRKFCKTKHRPGFNRCPKLVDSARWLLNLNMRLPNWHSINHWGAGARHKPTACVRLY
jgi:hypothetical protein